MKKYIWANDTPFGKRGEVFDCNKSVKIDELLAEGWIEEAGRWKPKLGEDYWVINFSLAGGVFQDTWDDGSVDSIRLERGNVFKTEKEATAAAKKVRALLLSLHE